MGNLNDYLNDHLAGAVVAVELLGTLIDHSEKGEFYDFCQRMCREVESDRQELRSFMERLGMHESAAKKAAGWFAEKAAQIKLMLGGEDEGGLGRLQALEGLVLGIMGKKALWTALRAMERPAAAWKGLDLERLIGRAEEQMELVEGERIKAACQALPQDLEKR